MTFGGSAVAVRAQHGTTEQFRCAPTGGVHAWSLPRRHVSPQHEFDWQECYFCGKRDIVGDTAHPHHKPGG